MSYDLYLVDPLTEKTIVLAEPHQFSGATLCPNGVWKGAVRAGWTSVIGIERSEEYAQSARRRLGA